MNGGRMPSYGRRVGALLVVLVGGVWLAVVNHASAPPDGVGSRPTTAARSARQEKVAATVVRHVDGDTLVLDVEGGPRLAPGPTRVRLLEIDTPESVAPGEPVECYAHRATALLERLAPVGSRVRVLPDRDLIDPYGRTLLYVWTDRGTFVNLAMVQAGAARAVLYEPNDRHIATMRRAEAAAVAAGRGLWGRCWPHVR